MTKLDELATAPQSGEITTFENCYFINTSMGVSLSASTRPTATDQFQARVAPWMQECFGAEISSDKIERGDRLVEEVFETLQSADYPPERILPLRDYTWSRAKGNLSQEVGGVMVTLAAFCLAHGMDMHAAGETELARIWTKIDKIRAKQAAKPTGSARPVPTATDPVAGVSEVATYDEGLLGDWGGGNVEWWQDYIRCALGRAHDFYAEQFAALRARPNEGTFAEGVAICIERTTQCGHSLIDNDYDEGWSAGVDKVLEELRSLTVPEKKGGRE